MKRKKIRGLSTQVELDQKIRRTWTVRPVTQVVPSKKVYSRKHKHKGHEDF